MALNIEALTTELISLPRKKQLEIARFLLFLDNQSLNSDDVNTAWEKEITDRVHAVDAGTAIGVNYGKAMRDIEKRFAS